MFSFFVKADQKKYMNRKNKKTGYFLSKCANIPIFFTYFIYVTPVNKKNFSNFIAFPEFR